MVQAHVAWDPTLDIYEASRDLQRAQTQPWFADYLHPTLEEYFQPEPRQPRLVLSSAGLPPTRRTGRRTTASGWPRCAQFDRLGGLIGMGDDAGFIYQMYGFGLIRSMELHQEAGFHPLKIIQQATGNNAKILGQEEQLGRVRAGFAADLIVVNGNPLENLKVLYPSGDRRNPRRQAGAHRRRRVDHQGRNSLPRSHADGAGERDGGAGTEEVSLSNARTGRNRVAAIRPILGLEV